MRYRGIDRGLTGVRRFLLPVLALALSACEGPVPQDPPIEAILLDSVPGAGGATIRVVEVGFGPDGEEIVPDSLEIRVGDWVDFRTRDGSPRVARFRLLGLDESQYGFLTDRDLLSSPPLVAAGAHWVVAFDGAPEGRYPFEVEGPRGPVYGVLWVGPPGV